MKQWLGLTLLAILVLASAFGLSLLATDQRQDSVDIDPLVTQVSGLASEVREIRTLLAATPTLELKPSVPTPSPTPEPVVARMANGATVKWQGMRLTVDGYRLGSSAGPPRADFTLENVDAPPELTSVFQSVKVVDVDGSICNSGAISSYGGFTPLEPGERLTFGVYWGCPNRNVRSMAFGGGAIVLEYP